MISSYDKSGEIRLSFCNDEYIRITAAGKAEAGRERPCFSGTDCVLLCGRGVCVQTGKDNLLLAENEAALVAPDTLFYVWGMPTYVRFFSPRKLFDGTAIRVRNDAVARIETLICGKTEQGTGARLTSELCSLLSCIAYYGEKSDAIEDAKSYIEQYYYLPVDVGMLAESAGYSRGYFTVKFTADTGCSPYKYLTLVRMKNAERMLACGGMSVSAVAAACGYAGAERFCEMFRKYKGISPRRYGVRVRESERLPADNKETR